MDAGIESPCGMRNGDYIDPEAASGIIFQCPALKLRLKPGDPPQRMIVVVDKFLYSSCFELRSTGKCAEMPDDPQNT